MRRAAPADARGIAGGTATHIATVSSARVTILKGRLSRISLARGRAGPSGGPRSHRRGPVVARPAPDQTRRVGPPRQRLDVPSGPGAARATFPVRAPAAGGPGTISPPARRARARCVRVGHRLMGAYAVFYRSSGQASSWMRCWISSRATAAARGCGVLLGRPLRQGDCQFLGCDVTAS